MDMEKYKTGKNENVKTQNEMKKFPNHFGHWIAEDAPHTVSYATEALKRVAKRLPAVPCFHVPTQLSVGLRNVCHICH